MPATMTARTTLDSLSDAARAQVRWGGYNGAALDELLAAGAVRRAPEHGGAVVLTPLGGDMAALVGVGSPDRPIRPTAPTFM